MQEAVLLPAAKNREFADCGFLIWGMPTGNSPMDRLMTKQANVCLTNAKVLISTVSSLKEKRRKSKIEKWKLKLIEYSGFQTQIIDSNIINWKLCNANSPLISSLRGKEQNQENINQYIKKMSQITKIKDISLLLIENLNRVHLT